MTIAPFAFGVIACLAAQGAIFVFTIIIAAVATSVKRSQHKPEESVRMLASNAPEGQK